MLRLILNVRFLCCWGGGGEKTKEVNKHLRAVMTPLEPSLRGGPEVEAEVAIQTNQQTAVFGLFWIAASA
jgi:hypothetical protein